MKFFLSSLFLFILLCSFFYFFNNNISLNSKWPYIVVLPHHSITWYKLNEFYSNFTSSNKNINKIIIISPDHYNSWWWFASWVPHNWLLCFLNSCVNAFSIDNLLPKLSSFPLFQDWSWSTIITREHWVWLHFPYINRYFWTWVEVVPLVVHREKELFFQTDDLFKKLLNIKWLFYNQTLIIASVDFSHHIDDEFSKWHDEKTLDVINHSTDFGNIEVDCQNCLKLATNIAHNFNKNYFNIYSRTSVDSIMWIKSWIGNTSHIFWEFQINSIKNNSIIWFNQFDTNDRKIYWAFLWDTMLARDFVKNTSKDKSFLSNILTEFYQENNISKLWIKDYHKKLYWFDFVWVNLETVVSDDNTCLNNKPNDLTFVSDKILLNELKFIWVNIVNIANNHSNDCWTWWLEQTKTNINNVGLDYFWNTNILKKSIRWIKTAFIGINDFDINTYYENILTLIKELKKDWYKVVVSVHWGNEFSKIHNNRQESISHKLVDAWVNIVIWHHPHVLQDIEFYKWIPIIYSLWNFVFDQNIPSTLSWQVLLYSIWNNSTSIKLIPFNRNNNFKIQF